MPAAEQRKLDFIIAGAQKCGTTALHAFLQKHPQITLGDQQEMHFFDTDENFAREPVDYELLHQHFPRWSRFKAAGECTPHYIYYKPAMERIRNYNPNIKLIVLLRNPIERAFAHWNMQRFKKREPLDFLNAVKQEHRRVAETSPLQTRRFSYVDRGFYSRQLERVWRFFPREQVRIIKSEEFRVRPRETLRSVFAFLGVKPLRIMRNKDRNVVPYEREMRPEEREYLRSTFANEIATLERMLGWDCADWRT